MDAGEESLEEEPHANFHRHHNLEWTYVLLSKRWVIFELQQIRNIIGKEQGGQVWCLLTICC